MTELCGLIGDDLHHHHGGGDVVVGSGEGVAVLLRPGVGPAHNPHYDYESSSPLFPKTMINFNFLHARRIWLARPKGRLILCSRLQERPTSDYREN